MGTGTGNVSRGMAPLPAAPQPVDPLDTQLKARRAALRTLAARRGLQSTFLTTPALGAQPSLGGVG